MLKPFMFAGKTYQMDEFGNILSLYKTKTGFKKVFPDKDGYLKLAVKGVDGKTHNEFIHRIVYEVWVGPIPEGMTVDHVDDDKLNNHHSNLQLLSAEDNARKGNAKHWKMVSPEGEVVDIYNMTEFCKQMGLHASHMMDVAKGKKFYTQHKGWKRYDTSD